MTDSGSENSVKDAKTNNVRCQLKKLTDLELLDRQELCTYITKLHELLIKNDKKLKKYKEKFKDLLKQFNEAKTRPAIGADEAPATTNAEAVISIASTESGKQTEDNVAAVGSFVDEIRQAAEQAQNLNGFVYEPTSGLYYDQKTGYYYNAEYGLYYDGNNGCYYNYNQEKNVFEFHSQVQVQKDQKAVQYTNTDKDELTNYGDIDVDDVVEFDEFGGVITDHERLRKIREEKLRKHEEERAWCKKKKTKSLKFAKNTNPPKRRHKTKTRKRLDSSTDSPASDSESGKEKGAKRARQKSRDIEDGELTASSSSESDSGSEASGSYCNGTDDSGTSKEGGKRVAIFSGGGRFQDIAKKYPPSLRIIVQESSLDALKVGSLSLITYKGGSLGREGNHDVIIPDVNVSKLHMKFHYDHKRGIYKCIDLGSRNGTVLNGARMSATKEESVEHDLVHGSVLQIGQTKLLCHVHKGNSTCGLCEPGLLIEPARENVANAASTVVLTHREQLKMLQKKYGLEKEKFVEAKQNVTNYNDRAATRRIQIGSSTDGEKTQTSSVNTEISSENKGFKMLSKLGWSKGEALGKANDGTGLLEPINVESNKGKKGLGCEGHASLSVAVSNADKRKIETWKKAQARYQQTDMFEASDDNSQ